MEDKTFIYNFLKQKDTLCLATSFENKPWICTVFYSIDKDLNLVFASSTDTKHSKQLENNNECAVAIYNKDSAPTVLVEGVQMEGKISIASPNQLPTIFKQFTKGLPQLAQKYSLKELIGFATQSRLYIFKPKLIKYIGLDKKITLEL